jgi:hypothetical protein
MMFLKTLAHTLVFPGTVLVLGPYLLIHREVAPALSEFNWWTVVGSLWALAGIVVGSWCTFEFMSRGSGTHSNPRRCLSITGSIGTSATRCTCRSPRF